MALCSSALIHSANSVASLGCLLSLNTTVVDPPQSPLAVPPACHCGRRATRQSPVLFGEFFLMIPAPQAPVIQVANDAVFRSLYQPLVKAVSVFTNFLVI